VSYEKEGAGMLQDAIWADQAKLSDPAYCGIAIAFVKASLEWLRRTCRGQRRGVPRHRRRPRVRNSAPATSCGSMNEINGVLWPAPNGAGTIDEAAWARTVGIASGTKNLDGKTVLTKPVTDGAWTNDIVKAAQDALVADGVDIKRVVLEADHRHPQRGWRISVRHSEGGPSRPPSNEGELMTSVETQRSAAFINDRAHVLHSWSAQGTLNPIVVTGAEGSWFWDEDGNRYLDFSEPAGQRQHRPPAPEDRRRHSGTGGDGCARSPRSTPTRSRSERPG
jgi:hypothetical protein